MVLQTSVSGRYLKKKKGEFIPLRKLIISICAHDTIWAFKWKLEIWNIFIYHS